jgi:SpoVK/Ycf46/Vps4 family AAA+-type ATPase
MRKPKSNPVLQAIEQIFSTSKNSGLAPELSAKIKKELRIVSDYLGVTQNEAFFFSLIITDNFCGNSPDLNDICRHLDTNAMRVVAHMETFERLIERNYLSSKSAGRRHMDLVSNRCYIVNQEIMLAIMHNSSMPDITNKSTETTLEALGNLYQLVDSRNDGDINFMEFRMRLEETIKKYDRFPFIKWIHQLDLTPAESAIFIYTIWKSLLGNRSVDIEDVSRSLFNSPSGVVAFLQSLKNGKSKLIELDLMECTEARFLNDIEMKVSSNTAEMLGKDGIVVKMEMSKREGLITPDNISDKTLFYNEQEAVQIASVRAVLNETQYQELTERLRSKKLPLSTNILLYGAPGTGKTESVLQIAKATEREIIKVEISQMKSMWFGESEKIIKRVFTDYAQYCTQTGKTPILLFNEADAILGTRSTQSGGNTRQTENAIQNILLEELENFKGIFIATTNLVHNLDKAFERRFLFKIEFKKPTVESRCRIWMDKLTILQEKEAIELAETFDLSGGQIENIVRKCEIDYILHSETPSFETLIRFCREENISGPQATNRIGF